MGQCGDLKHQSRYQVSAVNLYASIKTLKLHTCFVKMVERTNVETRGDSLFWITIIFPAIAWLLYIGAVSHKLRSSKFGKEDFLLAAAVVCLRTFSVCRQRY